MDHVLPMIKKSENIINPESSYYINGEWVDGEDIIAASEFYDQLVADQEEKN